MINDRIKNKKVQQQNNLKPLLYEKQPLNISTIHTRISHMLSDPNLIFLRFYQRNTHYQVDTQTMKHSYQTLGLI